MARPQVAHGIGNHLGMLRPFTALPAIVSSVGLLAVLCAPLGGWEPLAFAGWLAVVPVLRTRVGERVAVTMSCRFRTLGKGERAALAPVWRSACHDAGMHVGEADLYLKHESTVNAYAVGRRSVALTSGALAAFRTGRLDAQQMRAVLLHELGHLATGGVRYGLAAAWLAWPGRLARRLVWSLRALPIVRRQPRALLALVVAVVVVVAVTQALQQRHLGVAVLLAVVALCAVLCPLLDAWAARRGELVADSFVAARGSGAALAAAMAAIDGSGDPAGRARLLARHPPLARRVGLLDQTAVTAKTMALR